MPMTITKRKIVLEQGGWIPDHGWRHPEHGGIISEDDALQCESERLESRLITEVDPSWLTPEQMELLEERMRDPRDPVRAIVMMARKL